MAEAKKYTHQVLCPVCKSTRTIVTTDSHYPKVVVCKKHVMTWKKMQLEEAVRSTSARTPCGKELVSAKLGVRCEGYFSCENSRLMGCLDIAISRNWNGFSSVEMELPVKAANSHGQKAK